MAKVWHYLDEKGNDVISEWAKDVPKPQRIKLQAKIDALITSGSDLPPQLLSDAGQPGIKKIKVQGNPKLRPLLCAIVNVDDTDEQWVILLGAYEIGWKYVPKDALVEAAIRRKKVLENAKRKTEHKSLI